MPPPKNKQNPTTYIKKKTTHTLKTKTKQLTNETNQNAKTGME